MLCWEISPSKWKCALYDTALFQYAPYTRAQNLQCIVRYILSFLNCFLPGLARHFLIFSLIKSLVTTGDGGAPNDLQNFCQRTLSLPPIFHPNLCIKSKYGRPIFFFFSIIAYLVSPLSLSLSEPIPSSLTLSESERCPLSFYSSSSAVPWAY